MVEVDRTHFYVFLFIGNLLMVNFVEAAQCDRRIIFLPQTHAIDRETSGSTAKDEPLKVAASQLAIAKYIDTNPELPVFSEQTVSQTVVWKDLPEQVKTKARNIAKLNFADGLPDSIDEATAAQISQLNDIDAASLELIREKIPAIYPVISPQDKDQVFDPIKKWTRANPDKPWPPEIVKLVRDKRERLALQEILKFFKSHPHRRDVLLTFGSNHNFSIYPDLFDPACVFVPYEFHRVWYGKFRGGYGISPAIPSRQNRSSR